MQHGLRHGDYTRYRRYCSARLRRLYRSLKFTHGRGKYAKRFITESTVTDVSRKSSESCNGEKSASRWPKCTPTHLPYWLVKKGSQMVYIILLAVCDQGRFQNFFRS